MWEIPRTLRRTLTPLSRGTTAAQSGLACSGFCCREAAQNWQWGGGFKEGAEKAGKQHWTEECGGHVDNKLSLCPDGAYVHTLLHGMLGLPATLVTHTIMEEEPEITKSGHNKEHEHSRVLPLPLLKQIVIDYVRDDHTTVGIRKVARDTDLADLRHLVNHMHCSYSRCCAGPVQLH